MERVTKANRKSRSARVKKIPKARLHLRPGKPIGPELRKVALLQIGSSLLALKGNNALPDRVHDVRTYIKKLRAILHLASPVISKRHREHAAALLRNAAARLAPLRDSEVLLRTLDNLLEEHVFFADSFSSLRAGLADTAEQRRRNDAKKIPLVLGCLRKLKASVEEWPLEKLEAGDLKNRIRRSYRRGRIAMKHCCSEAEPDAFHLWRKQVKLLWYQLRITAPFWKNQAADLIDTTDKIGQLAGEERDLSLLRDALEKRAGQPEIGLLGDRIFSILPQLRREALDTGIEFYRSKPRSFVHDLDL